MKTIELDANERIVAVVPEVCAGAGTTNMVQLAKWLQELQNWRSLMSKEQIV